MAMEFCNYQLPCDVVDFFKRALRSVQSQMCVDAQNLLRVRKVKAMYRSKFKSPELGSNASPNFRTKEGAPEMRGEGEGAGGMQGRVKDSLI